MLGKAVIKVSIQEFFIIFMFNEAQVTWLISVLPSGLASSMEEMLEKQKKKLFAATAP